jgi:hypothetical protein
MDIKYLKNPIILAILGAFIYYFSKLNVKFLTISLTHLNAF